MAEYADTVAEHGRQLALVHHLGQVECWPGCSSHDAPCRICKAAL
jgi:hypothetical protein